MSIVDNLTGGLSGAASGALASGGNPIGAIVGGALGLFGSNRARKEAAAQAAAFERARQEFQKRSAAASQNSLAAIDPLSNFVSQGVPQGSSISTGFGTATVNPNSISTSLSGPFSSISNQLLNNAGGAFGSVGFNPNAGQGIIDQALSINPQNITDPFQATQNLFNRFESILKPARDQQRQALESQLLRTGRLGLNAGGKGSPELLAFQEAINRQQNQNLANAFGQALDLNRQQFSQGLQNRGQLFGFGQGLFDRSLQGARAFQDFGNQSLSNAIAINQLPLGLINAGFTGNRLQQSAFGLQGGLLSDIANLTRAANQQGIGQFIAPSNAATNANAGFFLGAGNALGDVASNIIGSLFKKDESNG